MAWLSWPSQFVNTRSALRATVCATSVVFAKVSYGNVVTGELDGMADAPFLKLPRIGLEMELKRERVVSECEGLVLVVFVRDEARSVIRQIEGVAVPVQYRRALGERLKAGSMACVDNFTDPQPISFTWPA